MSFSRPQFTFSRALLALLVIGSFHQAHAQSCAVSSNIAPNGVASQTTDLGTSYLANKANNGIMSDFSATHYNTAGDQSWSLSYAESHLIDRVTINSRTDCCGEKRNSFRDIIVSVEDESGQTVYQSDLLNPENVLSGPYYLTVDLPNAVQGNVVRVTRLEDLDHSGSTSTHPADARELVMSEVVVEGCVANDFTLEEIEGQQVMQGEPFELVAQALGSPTNLSSAVYSAIGLPLGLSIDSQTGLISGAASASGTFHVQVRVSDGSFTAAEDFSLLVIESYQCTESSNIASQGTAAQTSTISGLTADLAINGDISDYAATHYSTAVEQSWELSFDGPRLIEQLELINRPCCVTEKSLLRDVLVTVEGLNGAIVYQSELLNPENVLVGPESLLLDLPSTVLATKVTVTRLQDLYLSATTSTHPSQYRQLVLAEVEVQGCLAEGYDGNTPYSSVYPHSYHFVDAGHTGDSPVVYGLIKDTSIYWQGEYYELDAGEVFDIGVVSQGDVIESNKPLSIGSNKNAVDMPLPIEFAGSGFVIPFVRYDHKIFVKNIESSAVNVEFFNGATTSMLSIESNQIVQFESVLNGVSASIRAIDSSAQFLVGHRGGASGTFDVYPVAPAATEVFGVRSQSGRISALYDQTTVRQYAANGATAEHTIDVGDIISVIGANGTQGAGDFVRVIADKPIGAIQHGDGDEQTAFLSKTLFARNYILPTDTQYVAMGCFGVDSTISIYSPSDELIETVSCIVNGDHPGKAYLGSTTDGTQFVAGSRIESTEPIYLIYENALLNDETNLVGSLFTQPHAYHFLNALFEGDSPAVYGIVDNTEVFWKDSTYQIDAGELFDIGVVSQGDVVESSHALSIGSNRNGTDMPVPIEFSGTQFSIPLQRDTHYIYVKNMHHYDVDVDFFNGVFSSVETIPANTISRLETTSNGVRVATVESADQVSRLLVSHVTNTGGDAYPVAPLANQIFGIDSSNGYLGGVEDDIAVSQYADNGSTLTSTIDIGTKIEVIGDGALQGEGSFVRIEADDPVAGVQFGDGDGGDQTAYMPEWMFARNFVLPVDSQYVAVGCEDENIQVTIHGPNGNLTDTQSCNAVGDAPGKAYFGGGVSVSFEAGSRVTSSEPIYLIYEASATNDEHNLMGERRVLEDVRPSSFGTFYVRPTGNHFLNWGLPEFDSNSYTLGEDNTVLQRLDENGDWITQNPALYTTFPGFEGSFRFTTVETESGFYEYRLLREYVLENNQAGPFPVVSESYVEEPFTLIVLPSVELTGELTWASTISVPEENVGGNYDIAIETRTSYTHTNGVIYPVFGFTSRDIRVSTISGGPHVGEGEVDGASPLIQIVGQAPGVYEYTASTEAFFYFQEIHTEAIARGFIEEGADVDLFETDLSIIDDSASRITVTEDIRPSTLYKISTNRVVPFATSNTLSHLFEWGAPVFDSTRYTLESDNTVLQRRNAAGVWVALQDTIGNTLYQAFEPGAGIYEYRLKREFTLLPIQAGDSPIEESYVEESSFRQVLDTSFVLSPEGLQELTILTLPSESFDGNYNVEHAGFGVRNIPADNGITYQVNVRIFNLNAATLEGGPANELQDGGDDAFQITVVQNQPLGTYEYRIDYEATVFLENDFNLAVSQGHVTNDASNHEQFMIEIYVNGETASQITVSSIEPIDSDGDGIYDAVDPYPHQNNTQCFP